MYFECPHFIKLLVGAGSACPNAPTDISVDVFGRADPAPTGLTTKTLLNYGKQKEKHLGDYHPDFDYDSYRYRDIAGSDFVLVGNE